MPEENNGGQPQQAVAQTVVAQTGQQTPPVDTTQSAATPGQTPAADSGAQQWKEAYDSMLQRFQGLSRQYTTLEQQRAAQENDARQAAELAGTLQAQLETTQAAAITAAQALAQREQQLAQAQQEAAYWNLVNAEFSDLAGIAGALQRMPTVDAQRALFDQVRQQMGTQVATAARQAVASNLQGATPGAGPVAGGGAGNQPSYEEVMQHIMDPTLLKRDPTEYNRWWTIYERHPGMGHESLGVGWNDPFANDYQRRTAATGQNPAALNERHSVQAFEEAGRPSAMPTAWGGATPPRPGADPFSG